MNISEIRQKDWTNLEQMFSWVADMKEVPQHKKYHGEGNVAIHTQMVLHELQQLPVFQVLPEEEQDLLWMAALLHDVEKRSTSKDEGDGVITSHNHARKGEHTARGILYRDIPVPFHIREQITSLVRFHGLPLWLMEKNNPEKRLHEVAFRCNTRHLRILSEADARGRICEDLDKLLDSIEWFELYCKEQECWEKPREFATSNARFHYFHTPDSYIDYVPFDNHICEVTILSGLPGMGKDHYIQSLKTDIPVISLDAIRRKYKIDPTDKIGNSRVVQEAKEEARNYLRNKQDFIWNATTIYKPLRSQLIDFFVSYNAKVKIVYIEQSYEKWRKQNTDREYSVPEHVLDKMLKKLEIPQITEAHEIEYHVSNQIC